MLDTHDEHGPFRNDLRSQLVAAGTEAAEQWLAIRANRKMGDVNRKRLAGHVVNALWDEIERAVLEMAPHFGAELLAAATARAEKAETERDELCAAVVADGSLDFLAKLTVNIDGTSAAEFKRIVAFRKSGGAAPDGPSEPVERSETSGGHGEGSNSSAGTAGLSEVEHKTTTCGYLACGYPEHQRNDTTEDGQHG